MNPFLKLEPGSVR